MSAELQDKMREAQANVSSLQSQVDANMKTIEDDDRGKMQEGQLSLDEAQKRAADLAEQVDSLQKELAQAKVQNAVAPE